MASALPVVAKSVGAVLMGLRATDLVNYRELLKNLKKKEFDLTSDDDDTEMDCTITLCKRSTRFRIGTHWALIFDWGSKQAVYEANEVDGYLIPSCRPDLPPGNWKFKDKISISCSPMHVNSEARSVSLNGCPYCVTRINCKYWTIELGKKFGLEIKPPKRLPFGVINDAIDLIFFMYSAMRHSSDKKSDGFHLSKASQPLAIRGSQISAETVLAHH